MDYYEAANFLFDLRRFSVRPGTASVTELLAEVDNPQDDVKFIQIAGSNGKGSTARMTESILRESGYTVGLYTSPHLETVRERIRIDGRMISKGAISEFIDRTRPFLIKRAAAGNPLTFFEVVTAMGIWYFAREGVDVAVLEVGLGGEYDATSAVDPLCGCVTNVTLEHTGVLGETIEEIARTKAKIAPPNQPFVTGTTGEALAVVRSVVEEVNGSVVTVGEGSEVSPTYNGRVNHIESEVTIETERQTITSQIPQLGAHQATNAALAVALVEQLEAIAGFESSSETIERGLRNAHWPGRFEVVEQQPFLILDGAHNPAACETLGETLSTLSYENLHLVFGAMHDKDHDEMVGALPKADTVVTCEPNLDRAEDPAVLAEVFGAAGAEDVATAGTVSDALATARSKANERDCILLTGSLFLVAEVRTEITRTATEKRVPNQERAQQLLSHAEMDTETIDRFAKQTTHHTIELTVSHRQAAIISESMVRAGGDCAVSGVTTTGELQTILLTGSTAAFTKLNEALQKQSAGLSSIADIIYGQIRRSDARSAADNDYPWDTQTAIMGILNVTPDSFHDGGEYVDLEAAKEQAESLCAAGADIIDIGGESTRPGAEPVSVETEIDRIVPVIAAISELDVHISVDTRKAAVAEAALDAGADIINDVTGLEDPQMRVLAAERDVPVIIMHSIDTPVDPDRIIDYDDVVADVINELRERVLLAEKAGIQREKLIVDPGLGFGKTAEESFALLNRIGEFHALGCPVLVGHSHKSMFGHIDRDAADRLAATIAATALATDRGADVIRVHDVDENRAAVDVIHAANNAGADIDS
ncbi:dihydropteroate synthase [Natronocalculus amylovorans]|uniref:Probable bifunctional folylpolyglutamate synthase/dihydropteroate synthase n=1 Tax=Natronocalculus amylovorans TaxID=2917812 RepID=A0AAE3FYG0_9EURY|nr:dihydropteroate synthase [Natronocalculus amylovorans]MCL9817606.1 dihydropteroate synthase [Natronocalculus amylovorans]